MKTNKFIAIMLLGVLATACSKDGNNRLTLLAEGFTNGNSKVLINPDAIQDGSQWVVGEKVKVNNQTYTVAHDPDADYYYLEGTQDNGELLNVDKLAFYPGESMPDKFDIDIVGDTMLIINSLSVRFNGDGSHEMAFPMVAKSAAGKSYLHFYHLSGGFRLTLRNNRASAVNVASVKVVAQSDTAVQSLGYTKDNVTYTAKWAVQGPTVPSGRIGSGEPVDAKYCSEMYFDLVSSTNDDVTIAPGNDLKFCIPVTISSVAKLIVIGYASDGTELFQAHTSFETPVPVERNHMYDLVPVSF